MAGEHPSWNTVAQNPTLVSYLPFWYQYFRLNLILQWYISPNLVSRLLATVGDDQAVSEGTVVIVYPRICILSPCLATLFHNKNSPVSHNRVRGQYTIWSSKDEPWKICGPCCGNTINPPDRIQILTLTVNWLWLYLW